VAFIGFDVIKQVPDAQPTNFQYKKPAIKPKPMPKKVNQFLLQYDSKDLSKCSYFIVKNNHTIITYFPGYWQSFF